MLMFQFLRIEKNSINMQLTLDILTLNDAVEGIMSMWIYNSNLKENLIRAQIGKHLKLMLLFMNCDHLKLLEVEHEEFEYS